MSPRDEGAAPGRRALARLVGRDTDTFAAQHWGASPLLTPGRDTFDDLFSADAADELLADRALRTPFIRMANEGTVLSASAYTASGGFGAEVGDQLDSAKALRAFAGGATIVLQGLHRTWAPIADFTRELVGDLGHPAQVNAYITPASSRGFDPHYDTHDVFVIQISGEKHWTIHEPVHEHPLADQPWTDHRAAVASRAEEDPVIDATFRPGDVLYLPRGWIHSAVAQGGTSIHLTIGVRAATRADLLRRLLGRAADDPQLRRPLALGVDYRDASFADEVAATVAAARALLDRTDAAAAGALMAQGLTSATRPAPVRPLATVELLADLPPTTVVGWRPARLRDGEGDIAIVLSDRTITLPAEARTAIHALVTSDHPAGQLPGLDPESSLVVARRLLREAVLVAR